MSFCKHGLQKFNYIKCYVSIIILTLINFGAHFYWTVLTAIDSKMFVLTIFDKCFILYCFKFYMDTMLKLSYIFVSKQIYSTIID